MTSIPDDIQAELTNIGNSTAAIRNALVAKGVTPTGGISSYSSAIDIVGGGSRNIGEIISSTIPLVDSGLHLLDGALIQRGVYSAFVDYMSSLYSQTTETFVQPILTKDGMLGLDTVAVFTNVPMEAPHGGAYGIFGNDGIIFHSTAGYTTGYIDIYSPQPLNVTNIQMRNQNSSAASNRASAAGVIYGSNDGANWVQLTTYTNTVQEYNETWDINLSSNTEYYNYYRIESTQGGTDNYWCIGHVQLTATCRVIPTFFTYESIWQNMVAVYGSCGKFVYDSTNNTVRLPKISNIIEGTTDENKLGDLVKAGLPNITGAMRNVTFDSYSSSFVYGAFDSITDISSATAGSSSAERHCDVTFSAQASNSIYGNSTTVQPQTVKVLYYIVVATLTKTEIEVDINEVITDLNNKVDTDLANITDTAKVSIAHDSMPSSAYIDLTVGASDTKYTAPADGYFMVHATERESGYLNLYISDGVTSDFKYVVTCHGTNAGYNQGDIVPIKKGDVCTLNYDGVTSFMNFRFIYAVGSESEVSQ